MANEGVFQTIATASVVPVIVIETAEASIPLADALLDGGLPLVEITFRTAAAAAAIEKMRRHRPELLVGAGTVVTAENIDSAVACGAQFCVAPGLNPERIEQAKRQHIEFIPGVCTPSETEHALALGCKVLKFFPSEASGGSEMIKALASPYKHLGVRFIPTGGVNLRNLTSYLTLDAVVAVGGTWIATKQDMAAGNWQAITDRCKEVVEVVTKVRNASMAI